MFLDLVSGLGLLFGCAIAKNLYQEVRKRPETQWVLAFFASTASATFSFKR